jgi:hypothetical protein
MMQVTAVKAQLMDSLKEERTLMQSMQVGPWV